LTFLAFFFYKVLVKKVYVGRADPDPGFFFKGWVRFVLEGQILTRVNFTRFPNSCHDISPAVMLKVLEKA